MVLVEQIFYKKVNSGDLYNIDREIKPGDSGGGQTYFDLAGIDQERLYEFLEYGYKEEKDDPETFEFRYKYTINVVTLGKNEVHELEFDPRRNRKNYKLSNQRNNRHPAWKSNNGFPKMPVGAKGARDITNIPKLFIYIIKTSDKKYYAGYVNNILPQSWINDIGLEKLLVWDKKDSNKGFIYFEMKIGFHNDIDNPFTIVDEKHDKDDDGESIERAIQLEEMYKPFDISIDSIQLKEHDTSTIYMPLKDSLSKKVATVKEINYVKKYKRNAKLGDTGEELVFNYEKDRLTNIGRKDLADKVQWVSKSKGDGLGYDIESWEILECGTARPIYIEVKATTADQNKPFDISANEVIASKEYGDQYRIYRVYNIGKNTGVADFYITIGGINESYHLVPTSYKAYYKEK